MKKQSRTNLVHYIGLGKGQRLTYKASQPLSQAVIPSFNVSGLTGFFTASSVLFIRNDLIIGFPEIRLAMTCV